jgi:hypothetical protein
MQVFSGEQEAKNFSTAVRIASRLREVRESKARSMEHHDAKTAKHLLDTGMPEAQVDAILMAIVIG